MRQAKPTCWIDALGRPAAERPAARHAGGSADPGLDRREGDRRRLRARSGLRRLHQPPEHRHDAADRPDGDLCAHRGRAPLGRERSAKRPAARETPTTPTSIPGLPPGPIANPGPAALEAALNPDETDFLYFVADGTGGHAFAKTLREHNRNVAEWGAARATERSLVGSSNGAWISLGHSVDSDSLAPPHPPTASPRVPPSPQGQNPSH